MRGGDTVVQAKRKSKNGSGEGGAAQAAKPVNAVKPVNAIKSVATDRNAVNDAEEGLESEPPSRRLPGRPHIQMEQADLSAMKRKLEDVLDAREPRTEDLLRPPGSQAPEPSDTAAMSRPRLAGQGRRTMSNTAPSQDAELLDELNSQRVDMDNMNRGMIRMSRAVNAAHESSHEVREELSDLRESLITFTEHLNARVDDVASTVTHQLKAELQQIMRHVSAGAPSGGGGGDER